MLTFHQMLSLFRYRCHKVQILSSYLNGTEYGWAQLSLKVVSNTQDNSLHARWLNCFLLLSKAKKLLWDKVKISFWNVPYTNYWTNGICILALFFGRLDGERLLVGFMQEPGSAWVAYNAASETWVLFFITEYEPKEGLKFQLF